jgi:hypothetical protein
VVNFLPEMILVPISLTEANAFVTEHYRHDASVLIARFTVGCSCSDKIVGVAVVCRPVAQIFDDGCTLVNRVYTDGTRSAISFLYGAVRRAAWARGYEKLITYTLPSERGKVDTSPIHSATRHDRPPALPHTIAM